MSPAHFIPGAGNKKREKLVCALALIGLLGVLSVCWKSQALFRAPDEAAATADETGAPLDTAVPFLAVRQTDEETAHDGEIQVDLSACAYEYLISDGGYYRMRGALDGRVRIDAADQYVHIVLDGATIEAREGPALYVQSASKVVLTLADGSRNTIADSANYRSFHDAESCVYSSCDLTINGSGALTVKGFYKDAIRSRDVVRILNGNINVTSNRTGIRGADGVLVTGGRLSISSKKDGVKTTKGGAQGRGSIVISGGTLSVVSGAYAFVSYQGDLYIQDCTVRSKSVIDTYDIGGVPHIESGCLR